MRTSYIHVEFTHLWFNKNDIITALAIFSAEMTFTLSATMNLNNFFVILFVLSVIIKSEQVNFCQIVHQQIVWLPDCNVKLTLSCTCDFFFTSNCQLHEPSILVNSISVFSTCVYYLMCRWMYDFIFFIRLNFVRWIFGRASTFCAIIFFFFGFFSSFGL